MRVFWREIDAGHGEQIVIINEDKEIIHQEINAKSGYYTGNGNPHWVGKKTSEIKYFWKMFKEIKGDTANHITDSFINDTLSKLKEV